MEMTTDEPPAERSPDQCMDPKPTHFRPMPPFQNFLGRAVR
jgi:hypothetical protein